MFRTKAYAHARAVFMPATTRAVRRHLPNFIPDHGLESGFDGVPTLSTPHQRFTFVRLRELHLIPSSGTFCRNAHHLDP